MRQERDRVVDAIFTLAPHVSIAHQVAGRIRLKISPSGIAAARKRVRSTWRVSPTTFPV